MLLPNGNLYAWNEISLATSEAVGVVANLGVSVYTTPTLLTATPYYQAAYTIEQTLDLQARRAAAISITT